MAFMATYFFERVIFFAATPEDEGYAKAVVDLTNRRGRVKLEFARI